MFWSVFRYYWRIWTAAHDARSTKKKQIRLKFIHMWRYNWKAHLQTPVTEKVTGSSLFCASVYQPAACMKWVNPVFPWWCKRQEMTSLSRRELSLVNSVYFGMCVWVWNTSRAAGTLLRTLCEFRVPANESDSSRYTYCIHSGNVKA